MIEDTVIAMIPAIFSDSDVEMSMGFLIALAVYSFVVACIEKSPFERIRRL